MLQSEGEGPEAVDVDGDHHSPPDLLNVKEEKRDRDVGSDCVSDIAHKSNDFLDSLGRKYRLFGRQKPIHHVLGAGNSADILLWRKKQMTMSILAAVTMIWLLFECIGYHLITFICHSFILSLSTLFLWSNLAAFSGQSPPKIPEVKISEDGLVKVALLLRNEFNRTYKCFQDVASKQDIKTFLLATGILWILSIVGNWFNFLTLLYLIFVAVLTLPMLYEKHEDQVDSFAEKALADLKKKYAILDERFLHKVPILSAQKQHRS